MRKLNQEEHKVLSDGVIDIQKRYTQGLLPEEEKLLKEGKNDGTGIIPEQKPTIL